jgi:2-dehydro-3-deoxyphosphogluconate aldolase/(4S)-4-hydroxy-2-oxoglutarate aldolase
MSDMNQDMLARIAAKRIVPVVVLDQEDQAEPLAETLLKAGLDIMEITFRTSAAEASIRRISKTFPEMLVGAGTVLELDQLKRAVNAGAKFAVAPGLNETIVKAAQDFGLPFFPGVMTPTNVEKGLSLGCKILKFFPAEAAGGVTMIKALEGPYAHTGVKFLPTGGIGLDNMRTYLERPSVAAIGGSWIVEKKMIAAQDWATIEKLTRDALAIAAGVAVM